ncbi:hypothetical protein [Actinomadura fibrosa]|uniref:hypothetical protein n=1 Tax=Actinomadura fibrosa TaxID=111802 RepID=UPI0013F1625B|nr:hypothetical protein [Actinomadura fibrosa]
MARVEVLAQMAGDGVFQRDDPYVAMNRLPSLALRSVTHSAVGPSMRASKVTR